MNRDESPTTGGRGRQEVPPRQPAVPVHHHLGGRRAVARGRAVRAGIRLPGAVPQGGGGGDPGGRAGGGEEVPRPEALAIVAVGPIDKDGKPLGKKK